MCTLKRCVVRPFMGGLETNERPKADETNEKKRWRKSDGRKTKKKLRTKSICIRTNMYSFEFSNRLFHYTKSAAAVAVVAVCWFTTLNAWPFFINIKNKNSNSNKKNPKWTTTKNICNLAMSVNLIEFESIVLFIFMFSRQNTHNLANVG